MAKAAIAGMPVMTLGEGGATSRTRSAGPFDLVTLGEGGATSRTRSAGPLDLLRQHAR
ncbi:hypothetical protein [Streptomyces sp. NPDC006551]|uniref:hypothetical protein n=1 Tax=Streptomyces sp. NPDC006551 TaxID=3157178 RepID=UPI0033ABCC38